MRIWVRRAPCSNSPIYVACAGRRASSSPLRQRRAEAEGSGNSSTRFKEQPELRAESTRPRKRRPAAGLRCLAAASDWAFYGHAASLTAHRGASKKRKVIGDFAASPYLQGRAREATVVDDRHAGASSRQALRRMAEGPRLPNETLHNHRPSKKTGALPSGEGVTPTSCCRVGVVNGEHRRTAQGRALAWLRRRTPREEPGDSCGG